jgi:hypothetical protein
MNKTVFVFAFAAALCVACEKEDPAPTPSTPPSPTPAADTTDPVITLNGSQNDTVILSTAYNDPGATATDNVNGNISASIVVTGTVNTNVTGNNQKHYSVMDAAGNSASATRNIHVRNAASDLAGTYTVACSCATFNPGTDPAYYSSTTYTSAAIASATVNNSVRIQPMTIGTGSTSPNPYNFTINGASMTGFIFEPGVQAFTVGGTLAASRKSFTIGTSVSPVNYPNKTYSCTNVFSK